MKPLAPALSLAILAALAAPAALATPSSSQDIQVDEDALFSDTSSLADSAGLLARDTGIGGARADGDRKTVGFSGSILAASQAGTTRSYFAAPDVAESNLTNVVVGNVELDVRLLRGYKAFADLEWSYSADTIGIPGYSGTALRLPEMFLDANYRHRAYFRMGKQVLQWGRNQFFNPTDLLNVERNAFFERIVDREGTLGAKVLIPSGVDWNLVGFLDVHGISRADSLAGAVRIERLLGRTEFSFMAWDRIGQAPVLGADISTRLLRFDLTGEAALHPEIFTTTVAQQDGFPALETSRQEWTTRAAFGVGRGFRVSGIQDRLAVLAEYYYNGPGSTQSRLGLSSLTDAPGSPAGGGEMIPALIAAGLYEPHNYSRHYAAFFVTMNRFPLDAMTLMINGIGNLDQGCALGTAGVVYSDINDFTLSLWLNGYFGPDDTEYTLAGQALEIRFIAEAAF